MQTFIVNRTQQANGDHEVHNLTTGCTFMPAPENRINLGVFNTCREAVAYARASYKDSRINGCYYCANSCHTT